jgi:hypothetical protein
MDICRVGPPHESAGGVTTLRYRSHSVRHNSCVPRAIDSRGGGGPMDKYVSVSEVARMAGVSRYTVSRRIRAGELTVYTRGLDRRGMSDAAGPQWVGGGVEARSRLRRRGYARVARTLRIRAMQVPRKRLDYGSSGLRDAVYVGETGDAGVAPTDQVCTGAHVFSRRPSHKSGSRCDRKRLPTPRGRETARPPPMHSSPRRMTRRGG